MKTRNLTTNLAYKSNIDRVWSMPELGTLDYCRENVIRLLRPTNVVLFVFSPQKKYFGATPFCQGWFQCFQYFACCRDANKAGLGYTQVEIPAVWWCTAAAEEPGEPTAGPAGRSEHHRHTTRLSDWASGQTSKLWHTQLYVLAIDK